MCWRVMEVRGTLFGSVLLSVSNGAGIGGTVVKKLNIKI